ncbi:hypothetical protein KPH14_008305 [Odynerus spinipes]|uniref:Centromere protein L n=1 Tax=Odynerus spinipes TaxID=1348599 RepID=A0AAD9RGM5_9HYME|nr:hypothetical protein KPH14_008305 [Odynerus spinipes]
MKKSDTLESASAITMHTSRRNPRVEFSFEQQLMSLDDSDDVSALHELISLTWNIYGVSALFGFQYNDKTVLKLYGKRLREEIATSLPQENVAYNANISVETILMSDSMYLPPIKVDVFAKKIDQENSIEKCIYKGMFLSWKTANGSDTSNSIKLPLLLCRGIPTCMNAVHSTLSRMFDCLIIALRVKEDDLMWLLPIVMIPVNDEEYPKNTEEVRLEYVVPGVPKTDTIIVKLGSLDLVKILDVIIKDSGNNTRSIINLNIEHIKKLRKCLYAHTRKMNGLELGSCTLHRINLPVGAIMDNKMKIMDPEVMKRVLLYMTEKALSMLHALLF